MKKQLLFFIFFISLLGCSQSSKYLSSQDNQSIKTQVLTSFKRLVEASKALDLDGYFSLIDKDKFTGLNVNGKNWNSFNEFESDISIGFQSIKEIHALEFPNVIVSVIDNKTAILVNQYKQEFTLIDGTKLTSTGGGSQVWSKTTGKWLLVNISASLTP